MRQLWTGFALYRDSSAGFCLDWFLFSLRLFGRVGLDMVSSFYVLSAESHGPVFCLHVSHQQSHEPVMTYTGLIQQSRVDFSWWVSEVWKPVHRLPCVICGSRREWNYCHVLRWRPDPTWTQRTLWCTAARRWWLLMRFEIVECNVLWSIWWARERGVNEIIIHYFMLVHSFSHSSGTPVKKINEMF